MDTKVKKIEELQESSQINTKIFDENDYANFTNTCGVVAYFQVRWPAGGLTNFVLRPNETHSLYIGSAGNPCCCYSTVGAPDCVDVCGGIEGGEYYHTC
ncbi:hypothetical protein ACQ4WP_29035 [Janthinobacterium sp. GB4P2]|uniref:hypothetical protein n=1 Tax=Janthinobacterium sp. GB4P2 TaxID=3424189 RepID=UPI003F23FE4D